MKLLKFGLLSLCMLGLFSGGLNAARYTIPEECRSLKAESRARFENCVREKGTKVEAMDPAAPAADPTTAEVMNADDDSGDGE